MGGLALLGLQCVTQEKQAPHGRPHQMILCGATLCLSHSVKSPQYAFRGMSGHHSLRAFLSGGGYKKLQRWIWLPVKRCISDCPFEEIWEAGLLSLHSMIQSERDWSSRRSQAALQSCEYVSGPCVVVRMVERGRGSPRLLYLQTETYCTSAKQGLTTSLISVKCSA